MEMENQIRKSNGKIKLEMETKSINNKDQTLKKKLREKLILILKINWIIKFWISVLKNENYQ